MFQTSVLASGSKGNCILIRSRNTALILDAGISLKRTWAALDALAVPRHTIKAVIVSHEHTDHTRSAGAMARSLKIPLYISADTYAYCSHRLGKVEQWLRYFESGVDFIVGDILVRPFRSSHDAVDPNNFCFEHNDRRLGVALDLGQCTRLTSLRLSQAHTLILESNHDHNMLMEGPYDWNLKMRVKSEHGHLSNDEAVGVLSQVLHPGMQNIVLAHLSETNNLPDLAFKVMYEYLQSIRSEIKLQVASQHIHTALIDI
ncbi:MAG: MBL fold metallo-hydrolase [Candidatus Cloacimonadaceae bacterium]|jgi:phosphoribosyl 1,2-cyclic phosphodiesterase|nr:MBL fold metallo-hydrolase [Candidatus Cloacimonadota bacterium]MDY0128154.1 MBL fold metallo-hydrolase [Candidatus Cloacimonadaceae bacterium]MCB5254437.1 MBL fold metallo-hydrolase [Candidatus Cloacimonadota bacterium]MCK9178416.1 MBL fold metallo-hydrolase [Candidatus Cloacimonadota bacterium]MCK9242493.1 MBL fold metallo-hydrolase [Candidatus Cloacimonadota bacterium]